MGRGGARWSEVLPRAVESGLAPVVGSVPDVGVVGHTLGGGRSPLPGRTHGYAADHVRRLDVVTADGELRGVTQHTNPDLYGALQGNFGVVTEIESEAFPITRLYAGGVYFPGEHRAEVLSAWLPRVGEEMTLLAAVLSWTALAYVPLGTAAAYGIAGGAEAVAAPLVVIRRRGDLLPRSLSLTFAAAREVFLAVLSATAAGHLSPAASTGCGPAAAGARSRAPCR